MTTAHSQSPTSYCLPYVTLRPDYAQLYMDVVENVSRTERPWMSIYCANASQASIHAKLSITSSSQDGKADVDVEEAFARRLSVEQAEGNGLDLRVASTSEQGGLLANRVYAGISLPPTVLKLPKRNRELLSKGRAGVLAFDIAQTPESHYVVGGEDGQAHVGRLFASSAVHGNEDHPEHDDLEARAHRRIQQRLAEQSVSSKTYLKGHVGDIRSARFFPSGQVVLTTSSDCTARIFGLDGSNPRTLKGHRRAILDSAFLDRGKNVLTGSMDGTTRLWDVGSDKQIRSFDSQGLSGVNAIALGENDKLLFTGLSSGTLEIWDLAAGKRVVQINRSSFPVGDAPTASDRWTQEQCGAITSLAVHSTYDQTLTGTSNGVLTLYDHRMMSSTTDDSKKPATISNWKRNGATINDIQFTTPSSTSSEAIVATADGTPYRVAINVDMPRVVEEYCGWDVDNVERCTFDQRGRLWLAGAEGMARMY